MDSSKSLPIYPDVGVVALVPDVWGEHWLSRHHILTRLSRYFHVVWVNPAHDWHGVLTQPKTRNALATETLPSGFHVYEPQLWLPMVYRPEFLKRSLVRARHKRASYLLRERGCKRLILYLWRHEFHQALQDLVHDVSCYHIVDEYSFSPVELPLDQNEVRLIASVDQVFIHSPGLLEKKGKINPNTLFVPNGVDYCAYSTPVPEPADLVTIPHPRIGYTGWMKKHLDWTLLLELVQDHPDWSFVLIGPQSPHAEVVGPIGKMAKLPNVYILGPKPTKCLTTYPQHFDVCIMPYELNAYTQCIYPLKLHEYLASGRPTVGTPVRSLKEFSRVVALAHSPEEWSTELRKALSPESNTPERVAARRAVARSHDWQLLVARIAQTMLERLGWKVPDPNRVDSVSEVKGTLLTRP
ncbi:MAG: glycosyltransferase [Acidobacteria bacterium]|nr:glycosyltransferase [Acidobacteriota bacterium]